MRKYSIIQLVVLIFVLTLNSDLNGKTTSTTLQGKTMNPDILNTGVFIDKRDGKQYSYKTMKDGKRWMTSNLNYALTDTWHYENDSENGFTDGRLYTWEAAQDACPEGWQLPSDRDWYELAMAYGGTAHNTRLGKSPYTALIDGGEGQFYADLSGYRTADGTFGGKGKGGSYWTNRAEDMENAISYGFSFGGLYRTAGSRDIGRSCRCVESVKSIELYVKNANEIKKSPKIEQPPIKYVDFELMSDFSEGLAAVRLNEKWGFINKKGELVIDFYFEAAKKFSEGRCAVLKYGKWGYINKKGDLIIDFIFDNAWEFSEGLALVAKINKKDWENEDQYERSLLPKTKFGFINRVGSLITGIEYEDAESFSEGLAVVKKEDGQYGFLNKNGDLEIDFYYDYAESFNGGLAQVSKNGAYFYINLSDNIIIDAVHYKIAENTVVIRGGHTFTSFSEGLAAIENDEKWGFINQSGEVVILHNYDDFGFCSNNRISVEKHSKWGVIDTTGNIVVDFFYDYVSDYSEGLILVEQDGNNGYLDKSGKVVIDLIYDEASDFFEGLALVEKNGSKCYINQIGNVVIASKL